MINEKFLDDAGLAREWRGERAPAERFKVKEEAAFACCALIYNVRSNEKRKRFNLQGLREKNAIMMY